MADETPDDLPPLDDCGFVRVPTEAEPLWMTCNECGKSDHFWFTEQDGQPIIRCRCGARYDHAVRPDGETVPVPQLTFVPFKEGPMELADVEWDPVRIAMIVGTILVIGGGLAWAWLG